MCEYCLGYGLEAHHPRCPNYEPLKARYYCTECGGGIYTGEEYVENDDREYMHYDCIKSFSHLLSWLGCSVKEMNDYD